MIKHSVVIYILEKLLLDLKYNNQSHEQFYRNI